MKKSIYNFIVTSFIFILLFACIGLAGEWEDTYTLKECKIVEVDRHTVTAEDKRGNLWEFTAEGYAEGETVELVMKANHTTTLKDDIIKKVK